MVEQIRKTIKDYEEKVEAESILIEEAKGWLFAARRDSDHRGMSRYKAEMKVCLARRQAYIQARSDFKSLLGEL